MLQNSRYGPSLAKKGYVSLQRRADETFYRNWIDRNMVGPQYRQLSDAVTRRGHWRRKLKDISSAVDSLGNAKRRDIRHLRAVKDALVEYGNHGYLKRSMRQGYTSERDFNNVITKLDRYIEGQTARRRYIRNTALKTGAAASILLSSILPIKGLSNAKYDAEREALQILNTRPVAEQVYRPGDTEILADVEKAVAAEGLEGRAVGHPGPGAEIPRQAREQVAEMLQAPEADYREKAVAEDVDGIDEHPFDSRCIAEQLLEEDAGIGVYPVTADHDFAQDMSGGLEYADSASSYPDGKGTREVNIPVQVAEPGSEALQILNTRPVAEQVYRPGDTEILEEVEKAVADNGSGGKEAIHPGTVADISQQAREQVAAMIEKPGPDYRQEPGVVDVSGNGVQEIDSLDDPRCIAEQFMKDENVNDSYMVTAGQNFAEDMSGTVSGEPEAYSDNTSSQDKFNSGMKLRPLTEYSTAAERLMRLAAEAHTRGEEHKARELYVEATCLNSDLDGLGGDTNGDGTINADDTPLLTLIDGNIQRSNAYLDKALEQLEEGNRIGAYVTTHEALRYNRDSQDEVDDIRRQCNVIEVVLGDVAAYGDKLMDDGDITYRLEYIRPGDFGTYETSLKGSLDQTGQHADKLLNDTGRTVHKSVNTVIGVGDGVVSTALNIAEATLGKLGQVIGLNRNVNFDRQYAKRQVDLDERTQSGYGSYKTYIGVDGGVGEFLGDVWTIGNGTVNTAGAIVLVAYNGTIRTPVEGIGSAIGGEGGFRAAHDLASIGQIPICVVIDNIPVVGNNEPPKAQSYALTELAEGLYLYAPTHTNLMDRNHDGSVDFGELALSLPIVQGVLRPYDPETSMTERVFRVVPNVWAAERAIDHYREDGKKVICTEPGRTGGGPVKETAPGRSGGLPSR